VALLVVVALPLLGEEEVVVALPLLGEEEVVSLKRKKVLNMQKDSGPGRAFC
jgi:hypothetical protein